MNSYVLYECTVIFGNFWGGGIFKLLASEFPLYFLLLLLFSEDEVSHGFQGSK